MKGLFSRQETPRSTYTEPEVWLGEDGILRVDYGDSPCIDAKMIETVRQKHVRIVQHPVPVIFLATGRPMSTSEGRQAAQSPDICAITTAIAFVTQSWYIQKLLDLYLTFEAPPYPAFVFRSEEDAADWLRRYVV